MRGSLLLLLIAISFGASAQTEYHKFWVYGKDKALIEKGYLLELNDSSILLTESNEPIDIRYIRDLRFRKEGRARRGITIGIPVGGLALGAMLAKQCQERPSLTPPGKCIGKGMAFGSITGAAFGALIGASKIVIPIGSMGTYRGKRPELRKYLKANNPY